MNFLPLHRLAAHRGDGLDPKMLDLIERRARIAAGATVEELARHRAATHMQAGPNPIAPADLPEGVIRFPSRVC
ncbi:hypothetical protein RB623_02440 [Mesorhizobium sp. LHD-90]|uniref:hypothetical protein n=1 Tax=Mesorhizobium sp. LHD-90 TaxID=3071414 RepID=UPI0027DFF4C5|nr:hypothetical protein [Mesorhizobium sp. LHD-90]MDQ6432911.1 hypothetical protein [Mesorhizobium sp. LHD-90]